MKKGKHSEGLEVLTGGKDKKKKTNTYLSIVEAESYDRQENGRKHKDGV